MSSGTETLKYLLSLKLSMNWKEIGSVSVKVGVSIFVLLLLINTIGWVRDAWLIGFFAGILTSGVATTAFILHRRLKKGEEWGIFVGTIISVFVPFLLKVLFDVIGMSTGI